MKYIALTSWLILTFLMTVTVLPLVLINALTNSWWDIPYDILKKND